MAKDKEFIEIAKTSAESLFTVIQRYWHEADYGFKRRVLETLFGRMRLVKDELRPDSKTPFELLLGG